MDARLLVVGGKANKGSVKLKLPSIIGRSRKAAITVGHPMVSRQHCEVFEADGLLMLRDLDSTNGTFFAGKRVKEAPLPPDSEFTVGPLTFRVEYKYAGNLKALPQPIFHQAPAEAAAAEPDFEVIGSVDEDGPEAFAAAPPAEAAAEDGDFFAELGITAAAEPAAEPAEWLAEEVSEATEAVESPEPEPKKPAPAKPRQRAEAAKAVASPRSLTKESNSRESAPAVVDTAQPATPVETSATAAEFTADENTLEPVSFEPLADELPEAELIEEFEELAPAEEPIEEVAQFGAVHELEEEDLEDFGDFEVVEELPAESEALAAEAELKDALDELAEELPALSEVDESLSAVAEELPPVEKRDLNEEAIVAELTEVKEQLEKALDDLAPLEDFTAADQNGVAEALQTLSVAEEEQDLVAFEEFEAAEDVNVSPPAPPELLGPAVEDPAASAVQNLEAVADEVTFEPVEQCTAEEPVEFEFLGEEPPTSASVQPIEFVEETTVEPVEETILEPMAAESASADEAALQTAPAGVATSEMQPNLEISPFGEPPTVPQPAFFVDEPPPEFFASAEFDGVYIQASPDSSPATLPTVAGPSDAATETPPAPLSEDEVIDFLDATAVTSAPVSGEEIAEIAAPSEFEPFFDAAEELVPTIDADPVAEVAASGEPAEELDEFQPFAEETAAAEPSALSVEDAPADEPLPTEGESAEEEAVAENEQSPAMSALVTPTKKPKKLPWFVSIFAKKEGKPKARAKKEEPEPAETASAEEGEAAPAANPAAEPFPEPAATEGDAAQDAEPDAEKKPEDEKYDEAFDDFLKGL